MKVKLEIHEKFIKEVVRNVGYTVPHAIAELIDNSIDAGATKILLNYNDANHVLTIRDNGFGMSVETLKHSMGLGAETATKDGIGYYGTGMKTSIVNLVEKNSDYSKIVMIETSTGIGTSMVLWDIDSPMEFDVSYDYCKDMDMGTLITISGCNLSNNNTIKSIVTNLSVIYNKAISSGVSIEWNDTYKGTYNGCLIPLDPLYKDQVKDEDKFVVEQIINGVPVKCTIVQLKEYIEKNPWDDSQRFTLSKSGGYVYYGGRLIEIGNNYPMIGRASHPALNSVRFEFDIPKNATEEFGVKFNKTEGIVKYENLPDCEVRNLYSKVNQVCNQILTSCKKDLKANDKLDSVIDKINKTAKDAGLKIESKTPDEPKTKHAFAPRPNRSEDPKEVMHKVSPVFSIKLKDMGSDLAFTDVCFEGQTMIITLNTRHRFTEKILQKPEEEQMLVFQFMCPMLLTMYEFDIKDYKSNEDYLESLFSKFGFNFHKVLKD